MDIQILYADPRILVAIKPPGVRSTDEPGGMPSLLRAALGQPQGCVRTVHRLDQAVGGVMVFARSRMAASLLSQEIRDRQFEKRYLAVVQGAPAASGVLQDLLYRDRQARKTVAAQAPGKDVKPAQLCYRVLFRGADTSLVQVRLATGRTHQIRAQFSIHGFPLVGDGKYGGAKAGGVALWSALVGFSHPQTAQPMSFAFPPPSSGPWAAFPIPQEPEDLAALLRGK